MRYRYVICCILMLLTMLGASADEVLNTEAPLPETEHARLCGEYGLAEDAVGAWIEIEGTDLRLPIMQHGQDDGYYLTHDALGAQSESGALYTEKSYNAADFSDPVTVVYGRRMSDGTMFGSLQQWYSGEFEAHDLITLHLPGESREYEVFAAVPYSAVHLLYYYNFRYDRVYEGFFEDVYAVRKPGVQLREEKRPQAGEQVIILSTGLKGDAMQRYLVMARRCENLPEGELNIHSN